MTVMNINSDTPIIYYDESLKAHLTLAAEWEVEADVNEEYQKSTIQLHISNTLADMLREYQRSVSFEELSGKYGEISSAVSRKLTEKMQFQCTARLIALRPDERTAAFLKAAANAKRLSDLKAMTPEEQRKAILSGMASDDRSYKPDAPKPVGFTGMPAGQRAKFCTDCGSPLAPNAKFCGNCGKSVM